MTNTRHPLYRKWSLIRQQKTNPRNPQYHWARDLECDYFDDFPGFCEWVEEEIGPQPSDTHRFSRRDQRRGWVAGNITWFKQPEIARATEANVKIIEFQGRHQCMWDWSREMNIDYHTFRRRFLKGWTLDRLFQPPSQLGTEKFRSKTK